MRAERIERIEVGASDQGCPRHLRTLRVLCRFPSLQCFRTVGIEEFMSRQAKKSSISIWRCFERQEKIDSMAAEHVEREKCTESMSAMKKVPVSRRCLDESYKKEISPGCILSVSINPHERE